MYNWGLGNITMNKWFDKVFDVNYYADWISMAVVIYFVPVDTALTLKTCIGELNANKQFMEENAGPWTDDQNPEDWKADVPVVTADSSGGISLMKVWKGINYGLSLLAYGWNIYKAYKSEYYYYMFGYYIGKITTTTMAAVSFYSGYKIFPVQDINWAKANAYDVFELEM